MNQPRALSFVVVGVAVPKGSTRSFVRKRKDGSHYAATTADNPKTGGWQRTIANCAAIELRRGEHGGKFFEGPVLLEAWFYLPRPKALLTRKRAGENVPHTKKPDCDKLARAVLDSLTGVAWTDDAQVVDLFVHKRYCAPSEFPRAVITIREVRLAFAVGGVRMTTEIQAFDEEDHGTWDRRLLERASRMFNSVADLRTEEDRRINDWFKHMLAKHDRCSICGRTEDSELHYVGTVDSHEFRRAEETR